MTSTPAAARLALALAAALLLHAALLGLPLPSLPPLGPKSPGIQEQSAVPVRLLRRAPPAPVHDGSRQHTNMAKRNARHLPIQSPSPARPEPSARQENSASRQAPRNPAPVTRPPSAPAVTHHARAIAPHSTTTPLPVLRPQARKQAASPVRAGASARPPPVPRRHQARERPAARPEDGSSPGAAQAAHGGGANTTARQVAGHSTAGTPPRAVPQRILPGYAANPAPDYPPLARRRGWEGEVILDVLVDPLGHPREVRVVKGSGHGLLDRAALRGVRQWRFTPGRENGRPVAMRVRVPVRFLLR